MWYSLTYFHCREQVSLAWILVPGSQSSHDLQWLGKVFCPGWIPPNRSLHTTTDGTKQDREHCNESSITSHIPRSHLNIGSLLQIWTQSKMVGTQTLSCPLPLNFGVLIKFVDLSLTMVYMAYTMYNSFRYWRDTCFVWWNRAVGGQILATVCLWTLRWWCSIRHSCNIIDEYISSETN